jgi:N-acetylglutamate synthase-like GNAT family acetyltransferase
MQIRAATEDDIPAIVNLLKVSLGESLMPKSEEFWRWKHVQNPFGRSPILLAIENDGIVGVRAFMHWRWTMGERVVSAVRAVDTATHPDYQGKGIFKRLTLDLVEQCQRAGVHFVFNTPNASSKPGYLKMGWSTLGKLKIYARPLLFARTKAIDFDKEHGIKNLSEGMQLPLSSLPYWHTSVTHDFLNWRYKQNPNVAYYYFSDHVTRPTYLTVFRLKPYRFGIEFRVCLSVIQDGVMLTHHRHLISVAQRSGANLLTSAMRLPGLAIRIPAGPEVTVRGLSSLPERISFDNWAPLLGDMEVF